MSANPSSGAADPAAVQKSTTWSKLSACMQGFVPVVRAFPSTLVWPVLLACVLCGLGVWAVTRAAHFAAEDEKAHALSRAVEAASAYQQELRLGFSLAQVLVGLVHHDPQYDALSQLFNATAPALISAALPNFIQALELAPAAVIRQIYPPGAPNELRLGYDLLGDSVISEAVLGAVSSGGVALAGPVPPPRGAVNSGLLMVARQAIHMPTDDPLITWGSPDEPNPVCGALCNFNATRGTKFWGMAAVLINLDSLRVPFGGRMVSEPLLALAALGYRYSLVAPAVDGQDDMNPQSEVIVIDSSPHDPVENAVRKEIDVGQGLQWTLLVGPSGASWMPRWYGGLVAVMVMASLAAALLLFWLLISRRCQQMLLHSLLPADLVKVLQTRHDHAPLEPKTVTGTESPADVLSGLLAALLSGQTPDLRDVVLLRTVLNRRLDVYRPLNLVAQIQEANLDSEVASALMRQLGTSPADFRRNSYSSGGGASIRDGDVGGGGGGRSCHEVLLSTNGLETLLQRRQQDLVYDCRSLKSALAYILSVADEGEEREELREGEGTAGLQSEGASDPTASVPAPLPPQPLPSPPLSPRLAPAPPNLPSVQLTSKPRHERQVILAPTQPENPLAPRTKSGLLTVLRLKPRAVEGAGSDASSDLTLGSRLRRINHQAAGEDVSPAESAATAGGAGGGSRDMAAAAASINGAVLRSPAAITPGAATHLTSDEDEIKEQQAEVHQGQRRAARSSTWGLVTRNRGVSSQGPGRRVESIACLAAPRQVLSWHLDSNGSVGQFDGQADASELVPAGAAPSSRPGTPQQNCRTNCLAAALGEGSRSNEGRDGNNCSSHITAVSRPRSARTLAAPAEVAPGRAILDEVERLLSSCDRWQFDTWGLQVASGGHALSALGFFLMRRAGLIERLGVDPIGLARLLRALESGYPASNPYHNSVHAADVLHTLHVLLHRTALTAHYLDPLGLMAAYFAAIVHDFGHPGLTADFLIASSHPLALRYNDRSPLESHHAAAAFCLLADQPELDITAGLGRQQRAAFRKLVIEMVLATDMKQHFAILNQFKSVHDFQAAGKFSSAGRSVGRTGSSSGPAATAAAPVATTHATASTHAAPGSHPQQQQQKVADDGVLQVSTAGDSDNRRCGGGGGGGGGDVHTVSAAPAAPRRLGPPSAAAVAALAADLTVDASHVVPPVPLNDSERLLTLQVMLKLADVGHLGANLELHKRWLSVLEEEFFRQGDLERQLGLPISPLFDRSKQGVSKSQVGFYDFVALPLMRAAAEAFPGAAPLLRCFQANYDYWRQVEAEAEAVATGAAAAEAAAAAAKGAVPAADKAS